MAVAEGRDSEEAVEARRDPEAILARLREEESAEAPSGRGKLKVFFGYAAGVGKTYAMLQEAHRAQDEGADVVVGYVEPHTRADTLALLDGLEVLPPQAVQHRGIALRELDLDGLLARRPQIALVDELAHTNAPGCRHRKRYQDVEELLRSGIDVYTTVNVQHLEGLNDKIAAITAVAPAERIPDRIFDAADSVELVDLEPTDLIARLEAGKVYAPVRAKTALAHFFSRPNLAALREIALRRAADRLTRASTGTSVPRAEVGEDVLVLVTADDGAPRVVRAAANLAEALHGTLTALVVEDADEREGDQTGAAKLRAALAVAEDLGARVVTLSGDDPVMPFVHYAATSGIRQLVVGAQASRHRWLRRLDVDVRVMRAAPEATVTVVPAVDAPSVLRRLHAWSGFTPTAADAGRALAAVALATAIGALSWAVSPATSVILMVYLLVALLLATRADGFLYAVLVALGSVVAYNFFFTAPRFTFHAYGLSAPVIFAFLLAGTLAASSLAIRLKRQAAMAARRSYRTEVLLESSRKLQAAATLGGCLETAAAQVVKILDRPVVIYQADAAAPGGLRPPRVFDVPGTGGGDGSSTALTAPGEAAVAAWVAANGEPAGATTDTLRETRCLYLPIRTADTVFGVAGLVMEDDCDDFGSFERNLLVALLDECGQAAQALTLAAERRDLSVKAEKETLRSNLLRAISHDLRTPLTSISGDADMLLASADALDDEQRRRLLTDIYEDATWLIDLVENLLSVTRLDDGAVKVRCQPELVADIFADALRHVSRGAAEHHLTVDVEDEFLMAQMDGRLMVQVMVNLVNNAVAYTPAGSSICLSARRAPASEGDRVIIAVADDGPGIPDAEKARVFDLFYHGGSGGAEGGDARRGMGLGLALCRSILRAHGGDVTLTDARPHGCVFAFSLPAAALPAEGGEADER
ncbi:sensor histidine kinase KdpD [Adlercreutzia sp. R7]|uniref:histidine kinase n=1 Tax=Adlercreutzia wanghongyangiae TaxID=3111451 RepID=A0ABU6IIN9_9ACTN|nr:sensor histidine kinase KdpD [Adlercreutzia sp. R7]